MPLMADRLQRRKSVLFVKYVYVYTYKCIRITSALAVIRATSSEGVESPSKSVQMSSATKLVRLAMWISGNALVSVRVVPG